MTTGRPAETQGNALVDLWDRHVSKPSVLATVVGVATYVLFWWGVTIRGIGALLDWWFAPRVPASVSHWFGSSLFWPIYGYAMYVVPGLLAGLIARRSGVMHGLIVGTSVPIVHFAYWAARGLAGTPVQVILLFAEGWLYGWVLCGLGGLVADLVRLSLIRLRSLPHI